MTSSREIDYPALVDGALRGVVRRALESVVESGLPADHHFYIGFQTDYPGVEMSAALRHSHPEVMTIVLQHQFWDLAVDDEAFEVTLRFGGQPSRLRVPWDAMQSFVDPAAEFGLRFGVQELESEVGTAGEDAITEGHSGDVVSLEDFRKRDS